MAGAPDSVLRLVEKFDRHVESYRGGQYNEAQVRAEFIDPLFIALGWDIRNEQGYAEAYKDVIHEDAIKVGGTTKAPDYCFRIGGARKFFLEAKKPSVDIAGQPGPAYQLRRYAWSAKLPLSILTDFDELAVYDCRIRPSLGDPAAAARTMLLAYTDYAVRWDDLAGVFSKQAVLQGSFDKYVAGTRKRGTAEVDAEFLKDIESWRDSLARNIALRNCGLTVRQLNSAVQRTIDRIVFLRMGEDRGVESYGTLQALLNGPNTYKRLLELFYAADDRYNSGLFHFRQERDRPAEPDGLTPALTIDDKVLKDILRSLYYPQSPYEFSVLPADILGNVYEQFLGKVIHLTAGHRARVEEKPDVKKAGGVFYTPRYVVDYIVDQTVRRMLLQDAAAAGSPPVPAPAAKPAVEGQPASGAGAGAPAQEDPQSAVRNPQRPASATALTPETLPLWKTPRQVARLRICDPACGSGSFLVAAYRRLLDYHRDWYLADGAEKHRRELYQGAGGQWLLSTEEKRRILLNSIYGVDIDPQAVEVTKLNLLLCVLENENQATIRQLAMFHQRALPDLGDNVKCGNSLIGTDFYHGRQLALFDEETQYKINAFDWDREFPDVFKGANPGFDVVIGNPPYGALLTADEDAYLAGMFPSFAGLKDVYVAFIERGLSLLCEQGVMSYIVPSAWLGGPAYVRLREVVLGSAVQAVVLLPFDVFADAYVDTAIAVLRKSRPAGSHQACTYEFPKRLKLERIDLKPDQYHNVTQSLWAAAEDKKLVLDPRALGVAGVASRKCPRCLADVIRIKRGVLFDPAILTERPLSPDYYRYFEGDVYRYQIMPILRKYVEFGERMRERPKEPCWFQGERILLRRLVNRKQRLMACRAFVTFITNKNLYSVLAVEQSPGLACVLGIVNSRLLSFLYVRSVTQATKDDFPQVTIRDVLALPFPAQEAIAERAAELAALVTQMEDLQKNLMASRAEHERTLLKRQIDATDREIDALVYSLYGLTDEEIRVVEESARG